MKYYRIFFTTEYTGTDETYYTETPPETSIRDIELIADDLMREYGEQYEYIATTNLDEDEDEEEILESYWENVSYNITEITQEEFDEAVEDGESIYEYF